MDDLAALDAAASEFRRRLATVTEDDWTAGTPCGDWNVTALVEHVCGGNTMSELLLHGADAKTAMAAARDGGSVDLKAAFEATTAGQAAAFAEDGALARIVHHPAMDMPGDGLLMFRTADLALHAVDLAVALGSEQDLDPDMVTSLWLRMEPIAPLLAGSGMFGSPTGEVAADASDLDKLLHATGR